MGTNTGYIDIIKSEAIKVGLNPDKITEGEDVKHLIHKHSF